MDEDPGDSNIDDSGFIADDFHDSDAEEELEQLHSEPESDEGDDEGTTVEPDHGEENSNRIQASFSKKPAFDARNTKAGLNTTLENLTWEKNQLWSEKEKAMAWLVRRATLQGIPATFLDTLLEPENLGHLQSLKGETVSKMKKKLDEKIYFLGHEVALQSGTKVTYIPISHSLQRNTMTKKAEEVNNTAQTIPAEAMWKELESKGFFKEGRNQASVLYWDPFRKWRSKGGSTSNSIAHLFQKRGSGDGKRTIFLNNFIHMASMSQC